MTFLTYLSTPIFTAANALQPSLLRSNFGSIVNNYHDRIQSLPILSPHCQESRLFRRQQAGLAALERHQPHRRLRWMFGKEDDSIYSNAVLPATSSWRDVRKADEGLVEHPCGRSTRDDLQLQHSTRRPCYPRYVSFLFTTLQAAASPDDRGIQRLYALAQLRRVVRLRRF
jgi:hypothetical protein